MRVCVLLGGDSPERAISIASGLAVGAASERRGNSVLYLDPGTGERFEARDVPEPDRTARLSARAPARERVLSSLLEIPSDVDVVANILHGGRGEGGSVQAVLGLRGLPYFGSGPAACAVAMDKILAKRVLQASGIPVASDCLWLHEDARPSAEELARLGGTPVVVKPISAGSSVGVTIVREPADWAQAWSAGRDHLDPQRGLLVESFVPGRELTVGILGEAALPVVEIVPRTGFYDYERKYTAGASEYKVPAELDSALTARLQALGGTAFRAVGCRDLARVDFRVTPAGEPFVLEINTIPGMTATSLLPKAARAVGIEFDELVQRLCQGATRRTD